MDEKKEELREPRIPIDREKIAAFCQKWKIVEFSLFGSVLTDDFRPDSDVDVLVTFEKDVPWTLLHVVEMEEELAAIFAREVDLMLRKTVERSENYLMRRSILANTRSVYAA